MFSIPTFEEIRASVLRDTQSLDPTADISPDSDHYVHASRLASVASGQYAHQAWITRQIFPDTADSDYLERHASLRGLKKRNATMAAGTVTCIGTSGAILPQGLQIKQGNNLYQTTQDAVIDANGNAIVDIAAMDAGTAYNTTNQSAQLMAAPSGVSSNCAITASGGTDTETDASLLARLLEIIRRPPAGGNKYDYKNWALSVDGVTNAYVYPLRRGLGTVDVVITSSNGVPSNEIITRTQNYIDDVRPVTAKNVAVIKPTVSLVNITAKIKLDGVEMPTAVSLITAALIDYFNGLAPGDTLRVSQIQTAISNVAGVSDRTLIAPVNNQDADMINGVGWFRLGAVNLSALV